MTLSFCCDISDAKGMSAAWHGAERQHFCVMCHKRYEDMVMGKRSSSRVVAAKTGPLREISELQEEAESLAREVRSRRRKALDETGFLLCKQSLAECASFLEEMSEDD